MLKDEKQTEEGRERQIAKLIETGTKEDKNAIEDRDDEGRRWRAELEDGQK